MSRRAVLGAAVAGGVAALVIGAIGGVRVVVGGVPVSARSPRPAAVAAGVGLLFWWLAARRRSAVAPDLEAAAAWLSRSSPAIRAAIAVAAFITVTVVGTAAPSGADASGYLSQAAMWAAGRLSIVDPLTAIPGWPLGPQATSPLGWQPAAVPGRQVPTYAPGWPWLLAAPYAAAGPAGAIAVLGASAALAVFATAALSTRLGGPLAGPPAALALAVSPTFLFHALQPMSDVPAAAAWATCWWQVAAGVPARAGVAAALAAAIRPNLAPLALVPWIVSVALAGPERRRAAAWMFAAPVAVAGCVLAVLQWHWYGSPVRSGYGSAGDLFDWRHVVPNLRLYAGWLWQAEATLVVAAALALVAAAVRGLWRHHGGPPARANDACRSSRTVWVGLTVFAAGAVLAYLLYATFENWTYVRFLLPALSVLAAATGVAAARLCRCCPAPLRAPVVLACCLALLVPGLRTARALDVFAVALRQSRATEAGAALMRVLPEHAVLLTGEQSGSMRHLTGRPVVRWDLIDAASLGRALDVLAASGYQAWWVLDQWEEPIVRARFAGIPEAALDRPPDIDAGRVMRTRAWHVR